MRKLEVEREVALIQVKESARAIEKVQEVIKTPGDLWVKARMFDAQLEKDSHVSKTKMVSFLMSHGAKLKGTLVAMRAFIASFLESFPAFLESLDKDETSSSYLDLTPKDLEDVRGARRGRGDDGRKRDQEGVYTPRKVEVEVEPVPV